MKRKRNPERADRENPVWTLAEDGPDSARIRAVIGRTISGDPLMKGRILEALPRSPMVSADLEFERSRECAIRWRLR